MRGFIILLGIFGWIPVLLFKPHIGILVWDWVSHMNPHTTASNISTMPILDSIAAMTLAGLFISKEPRKIASHPIMLAILLYYVWVIITTLFGENPAFSTTKLVHITKVLLFVLLTTIIMQSPNRLKAYYWIMALSLGFFVIKGGLFFLKSGGTGRVQGGGGMLGDNNQLAMAIAMTVPVAYYLYLHPPIKKLKWPMFGTIFLAFLAIVGTQSRGGLVAGLAVMGVMFMSIKRKVLIISIAIPLLITGYALLPDHIKDRYSTIPGVEKEETKPDKEGVGDESFMGRVIMWKYGVNVADDNPILGKGFENNYVQSTLDKYMPYGHKSRAFHSIYFEVLGEHGYVGLVLFLTIIFTAWYSAGTTYQQLKEHEDLLWLADMARTLRISLIAYCVGGLTVNIATFDLMYDICGLIVLTSVVSNKIIDARITTVAVFDPFAVKEQHEFHKSQEKEIVEEIDEDNPFNLKPKKEKKKWSPHDG